MRKRRNKRHVGAGVEVRRLSEGLKEMGAQIQPQASEELKMGKGGGRASLLTFVFQKNGLVIGSGRSLPHQEADILRGELWVKKERRLPNSERAANRLGMSNPLRILLSGKLLAIGGEVPAVRDEKETKCRKFYRRQLQERGRGDLSLQTGLEGEVHEEKEKNINPPWRSAATHCRTSVLSKEAKGNRQRWTRGHKVRIEGLVPVRDNRGNTEARNMIPIVEILEGKANVAARRQAKPRPAENGGMPVTMGGGERAHCLGISYRHESWTTKEG